MLCWVWFKSMSQLNLNPDKASDSYDTWWHAFVAKSVRPGEKWDEEKQKLFNKYDRLKAQASRKLDSCLASTGPVGNNPTQRRWHLSRIVRQTSDIIRCIFVIICDKFCPKKIIEPFWARCELLGIVKLFDSESEEKRKEKKGRAHEGHEGILYAWRGPRWSHVDPERYFFDHVCHERK